jgi:hypothetical protein
MSQFSASEAALEGFRLVRRHPAAILAWCGVYFLGIMAIALVMAAVLGPTFIEFIQDGGLESGRTDVFAEQLANSWPAFILVLLLAMLLMGILTAAVYRSILRPDEHSLAYLRIGADEVRLAAVHMLLFLILMAFVIPINALLLGAMSGIAGPVLTVAALALIGVMFWVGVRLCLATPVTFAEHRISLVRAWRLTRGRFWPLLGMAVLAVIFYVMVWLLVSFLGVVIVGLSGGADVVANDGPPRLGAVIALLVSVAIQLLVPTLQVVMIFAPFAIAYQALSGPEDEVPATPPATAEPAPT